MSRFTTLNLRYDGRPVLVNLDMVETVNTVMVPGAGPDAVEACDLQMGHQIVAVKQTISEFIILLGDSNAK